MSTTLAPASLVHDADAEDEGFMIKAVAGGTGIVTDPAKA